MLLTPLTICDVEHLPVYNQDRSLDCMFHLQVNSLPTFYFMQTFIVYYITEFPIAEDQTGVG